MIFSKQINLKKIKNGHFIFCVTFCIYHSTHTVISNSEKLTHPTIHQGFTVLCCEHQAYKTCVNSLYYLFVYLLYIYMSLNRGSFIYLEDCWFSWDTIKHYRYCSTKKLQGLVESRGSRLVYESRGAVD